ncbi:MAG: OmpA family protein [Bacteroidota bacterium]|nr:OmpA family protein [Bacteroidota bacterium]
MKVLKFIAITFLLSTTGLAQTKSANFEKEFDDAEKIFSKVSDTKSESLTSTKGAYAELLPVYLNLYKQDPTNMNLAFKIGVCYQSARKDRLKSIAYFNKAVTSVSNDQKGSSYKEKKAPLIAYKYLGDAYHWNYEFDKAIAAYRKYINVMEQNNATDKTLLAETTRKMEMCNVGKRLVASPVKIKIQNLSNTVNSPYADYSAIFSADQNTLFFTSRRPQTTGGEKDNEGNYMEDIYMSSRTKTGWSAAHNIGAPINTEWHEATVGVSPDAQTILIYKDDMGDGNIYSTSLDGDVWSKPVKLNDNINTKNWEPSAFISADGNSLYFASNKPGGFGGVDLYMSKRGSDGDWGKATNLGANINTTYDEDAPSIHPDGVTLSFSSNGHNTMGGFDIFSSLLSFDGNWSEPVNVGYPINTTDDDIFYMVSPNGKTAYFSSFREDGLGEKDNYMATFLERKETPLTLIQGTVNDEAGMPAKKVMITVTDNETEEIVGVYNANAKTGQFLFILTPGKNYNITYQAENQLFYSENMEIPKQSSYYEFKRSVKMHPIVVGSKITLNNIFFDFDKATLRPLSNVELKNLVLLMKSNPNMKVEISGHTDSKGDDAYNMKLSDERAQAVVNRLTEKGIVSAYMKAKGYGETQPVAPNTKPNGTDDPEGRQLNRRVELTITEL